MKKPSITLGVAATILALGVSPVRGEQFKIEDSFPQDHYLTAAEYPCLVETIHVTGTLEMRTHWVMNPGGGYSWQIKQSTRGMTAVGLDTGETYRYNGPFSLAHNGTTDEPWVTFYPFEWTVHNVNHYVGPGSLPDLFLRQTIHYTFDRETGELKAKVEKDDVICR